MEIPFTLAGLALQAPTIKKQIELNLLLEPMQAARLAADAAGAGPFAVAALAAVGHLKSEWVAEDEEAFEAAEKRDRAIIAAALTKWTYENKPSQAAILKAYNLAKNYLESAELDPEFTAHYAYLSGAALHSKFSNNLSFEEFLAAAGATPVGYNSPLAPVVACPVLAASSPAPAAPPAPTPAVAVGPLLAPFLAATPAPAAEQLPRLANALTSRFTLSRLKKWLAEVGLIDPETGTAKPNAKPFEWAAAREALYKAGLLGELSSEQAADVFSAAFATKVSAGTMKSRESNVDKKGKFYRTLTHYKGLLAEFLTR